MVISSVYRYTRTQPIPILKPFRAAIRLCNNIEMRGSLLKILKRVENIRHTYVENQWYQSFTSRFAYLNSYILLQETLVVGKRRSQNLNFKKMYLTPVALSF